MISISKFDSKLLKVDKKPCKHINTYHFGCITMKDSKYVNIHNVNPLYFIVNKVDGIIEEKECK